jgi:type II secretory ATPase GspE/PulE/Tfp pilus assembly ATPase PilB-like protein
MITMSVLKVLLVLLFAAVVFYVCDWAFLDTRFVNTNQAAWNAVVLAGGLAGLAAVILVPVLLIGLLLGAVLFVAASLAYAMHRNSLVTAPLRVLTEEHLERFGRRVFGRKAEEAEMGPLSGASRDIIFMGLDDLPIHLDLKSAAERKALDKVERVLYTAITRRASTVGYLARPGKGEVKFRISGETRAGADVERPAADYFPAIIKRLAGLDPAETRKPQEGRVRAIVAAQPYELRIKTAGTVKGEQVAVRIVDLVTSQMRLEELGLAPAQSAALKEALNVRPGLVLLSGPQDSGLTTTLHACLRHFDRYVNNVIVFESHTDTEIENVQHFQVNQEDGPVAAAEVRSRIRMEPDVIGFDAVAQPEIAGLLAEAARDHTVVVGIRAPDSTQAVARLTALLASGEPLAARLQIVVNQRLVRLLCPVCREAYRPNPDFLRKANLGGAKVDLLYRPPTRPPAQDKPAVCPRCNNERYAGRTGLFEVMPLDTVAREMIGRAAPPADIRTYIRKSGARNLQELGLQMVIEGRTSIEEMLRAIKETT